MSISIPFPATLLSCSMSLNKLTNCLYMSSASAHVCSLCICWSLQVQCTCGARNPQHRTKLQPQSQPQHLKLAQQLPQHLHQRQQQHHQQQQWQQHLQQLWQQRVCHRQPCSITGMPRGSHITPWAVTSGALSSCAGVQAGAACSLCRRTRPRGCSRKWAATGARWHAHR